MSAKWHVEISTHVSINSNQKACIKKLCREYRHNKHAVKGSKLLKSIKHE